MRHFCPGGLAQIYLKLHPSVHLMKTHDLSSVIRKSAFAYVKSKAQISCMVTVQLISTLVLNTQIVQFPNPEDRSTHDTANMYFTNLSRFKQGLRLAPVSRTF